MTKPAKIRPSTGSPSSFVAPTRVLMGPGPSDVPPRVLAAMARPTIGHLDPQFVGLMDEIKGLLQYAFQTQNVLTMPVSGPGTAGMESCFANLLEPGDTIVVCQNGVFGGRMKAMAERCGATVVMVEDPWGRAVSVDKAHAALKAHPEASVFAFVHAETSTGVLSDAQKLAALAHEHDCLSLVDAVTSLAGSPLYVDDWGIDAVYSGSQKCLSCAPGLSPISFSARATERLAVRKTAVQSWFMDLKLVMDYWGEGAARSYHHTAPVNALYGLHEALLALHEEGLEAAWRRHQKIHELLRDGLIEMGIEFVVPENERAPQLNLVRVPAGVDEAAVRRRLLLEHDLEIGAGLGPLAGKVWRIGLMGYGCSVNNVEHCLTALKAVLPQS